MLIALIRTLIEKHWLSLTILLIAIISYLSLKPTGIATPTVGFDKVYHCIAYAVLVLPLALKRPAYWQVFALTLMIYGGAIELIQPMTGRQADWLDFIMNVTGVGIGILIGQSKFLRTSNN